MRRGQWRSAAAAAAVLAAAGCSSVLPGPSTPPAAPNGTRVATAPAGTSPAGTAATETSPPGAALIALARLPVKGRAPRTGYDRAAFGQAWTDDNDDQFGHNGCDTRNDILRRDLRDLTLKPGTHGCVVLRGVLDDPYTGRTIDFVRGERTSFAVQIDHVVALSDAWQKGAQYWSARKRVDLANDPLELLAVDGPTNEAKGDGDAATWLPPNRSFRCAYVARQIAIKAKYGIWVTAAERDAMVRVLARCPQQRLPGAGSPGVAAGH